jgi:hypothetical protein
MRTFGSRPEFWKSLSKKENPPCKKTGGPEEKNHIKERLENNQNSRYGGGDK